MPREIPNVSRIASGLTAYVGHDGENEIRVLGRSSPTGPLALVQAVRVPGLARPSFANLPLAITPDKSFLYAALRGPPFVVAAFRIRARGELELAGLGPLPESTPFLATDRGGRFLLAAASPGPRKSGARFLAFGIDSDGLLGAEPLSVADAEPRAHCIITDPEDRFAYGASTDGCRIHQFGFNATTGMLTALDPPFCPLTKGADPRHLTISPDGQFLYAVTEAAGTVVVFSIDGRSGRIVERQSLLLGPRWPGDKSGADIHLTPDGRYLYASERTNSIVAGFAVEAGTGELLPIGEWETEEEPRSFAISPSGDLLLVAGRATDHLAGYAIDPVSGRLTLLWRVGVGIRPSWVELV